MNALHCIADEVGRLPAGFLPQPRATVARGCAPALPRSGERTDLTVMVELYATLEGAWSALHQAIEATDASAPAGAAAIAEMEARQRELVRQQIALNDKIMAAPVHSLADAQAHLRMAALHGLELDEVPMPPDQPFASLRRIRDAVAPVATDPDADMVALYDRYDRARAAFDQPGQRTTSEQDAAAWHRLSALQDAVVAMEAATPAGLLCKLRIAASLLIDDERLPEDDVRAIALRGGITDCARMNPRHGGAPLAPDAAVLRAYQRFETIRAAYTLAESSERACDTELDFYYRQLRAAREALFALTATTATGALVKLRVAMHEAEMLHQPTDGDTDMRAFKQGYADEGLFAAVLADLEAIAGQEVRR